MPRCKRCWYALCLYMMYMLHIHADTFIYVHIQTHAQTHTHLPPLPHAYMFVHYKIPDICMYVFAHSHPRSNTYTSVLY